MKVILTILSLIISVRVIGQETKKVTVVKGSPPVKETFYVLKDDKNIKHGAYTKQYGEWLIKGRFDNDKRTGIWEYLDRDSQPELRIDFDTNKVLFRKPTNFIGACMIADGDVFVEVEPEQEPVFLGGTGNILFYILGLQYPLEARRNGIQGTVIISATITKDGKIIDERVESGPALVLNKEALRAIRLMPDEWLPGKINGNDVDMRILIPVKFKLS